MHTCLCMFDGLGDKSYNGAVVHYLFGVSVLLHGVATPLAVLFQTAGAKEMSSVRTEDAELDSGQFIWYLSSPF